LVEKKKGASLRFISTLKLKRSMREGCKLYVVIYMNEKEDSLNLDKYSILS